MSSLDYEALQEFSKQKDRTGVVYLSRVPPRMAPHEVRSRFAIFGNLGRIYLEPSSNTKNKKKMSHAFTQGWIEFIDKRDARSAVLALNGNTMGGKKGNRHHDDIWTCKYLPKVKWTDLTDQLAYDKNRREERWKAERAQARREAAFYLKQSDKARQFDRRQKLPTTTGETLDSLKANFRQRQPIIN